MHEITDHAQLTALLGDDPYLRWGVPQELPAPAVVAGEAVATLRVRHRLGQVRRSAFVLGDGPGVAELVALLVRGGLLTAWEATGISVPQAHGHLLDAHGIAPGGRWDWMWVDSPTPRTTDDQRRVVLTLDDATDAPEMAAFSERWSPTAEGEPGTGFSTLWRGVRAGALEGDPTAGELLSLGASQPFTDGVPHLAGIVTHGQHQGRGLARLVTESLTLTEVEATGVCTLGMYSDNAVARRLYESIGYRVAWAWDSRRWDGTTAGCG